VSALRSSFDGVLTYSTEMVLADNGDDPRTTQGGLGHRDRKHTAIYTRTAAKQLARLWR